MPVKTWKDNIPAIDDTFDVSVDLLKLYSDGKYASICEWIIRAVGSPKFSSSNPLIALWSKILKFDPVVKASLTLYSSVDSPLEEKYFSEKFINYPVASSTHNIFEFFDCFSEINDQLDKLTTVLRELERQLGPLSRQAERAKKAIDLRKAVPLDQKAIDSIGHYNLDSIRFYDDVSSRIKVLNPIKQKYLAIVNTLESSERQLLSEIKDFYGNLKQEYLPKEFQKCQK